MTPARRCEREKPIGTFEQALITARRRLQALQSRSTDTIGDPESFARGALQELEITLEELGVAGEELQEANQELILTRHLLETERERYRRLFEFAPDGYLLTDASGVIEEANLAAADLLHIRRDRLLGKPIAVYVTEEARADFRSRLATLVSLDSEGEWEIPIKRQDRDPVPVSVSVSRERSPSGELIRLRWLVRDLTSLKAAERDRARLRDRLARTRRLEAIGQLAGGVAHDFNNALTVIAGYAQLLHENLDGDESQLQRVAGIEKATRRATTLTRQLLSFSRKQVTRPRVIDLNELIRGLRTFLDRLIGDDIRLAFDLESGLGAVRVDENQLEQVILNLAVNARDAMPDGGTISFRTRNVRFADEIESGPMNIPPGPYVRMSVEDTGIGMNRETREHIFEPFYTTKARGHGTGLGLASSHGAVRQSGGDIRVVTESGRGSTFEVHLPVVDLPLDSPHIERVEATMGGSETILLVEDDAAVRGVAYETLKAAGYSVLAAETGEDALKVFEEHEGRIDLLLTDVLMPGLKGPELASRILELSPNTRLLLMSGYPGSVLSTRCELDPSVPFLPKPFLPGGLTARVREILDSD